MTLTFIDSNTDIDAMLAPYAAEEVDFITVSESLESNQAIATVEVLGETEKAWKVSATIFHKVGRVSTASGTVYLPKKCVKLIEGDEVYVVMPAWLARAKVLEIFNH